MDRNNPAVGQLTRISPALAAAISENPSNLQPWARSLLVDYIDELDEFIALNPDKVTFNQRLQFVEMLAKLGDAFPKTAAVNPTGNAPGFSVQIVFAPNPKSPPTPTALVIENE